MTAGFPFVGSWVEAKQSTLYRTDQVAPVVTSAFSAPDMPSLQLSLWICSIAAFVNCGLSAVGWIVYVAAMGSSFAYTSHAFVGGGMKDALFWIVPIVFPFALIVYVRFTLIMCQYLLDSKKFIIRIIVLVVFAVIQLLSCLALLVELSVLAPWNSRGDPSYNRSFWTAMLVGLLLMNLFSILALVFVALTSYLSRHPHRQYEPMSLQ